MPAPITVTKDQVAEAGAKLTASGERVTGWALRRVAGGGRPERLAVLWSELQAERPVDAVVSDPEPPLLPPAVAEHLVEAEGRVLADLRRLVAQAWGRAADLAARRVQDEVLAARERVGMLEDELAEAARSVEAADEQAALQAEVLARAEQRADDAEAACSAAEQGAREAAAAAGARLAAAADINEVLRQDLEEVRRRAAVAEAAAVQDRAGAAAAERRATEASVERDAARAEAAGVRQEAAAAREEASAEIRELRAAADLARRETAAAEAVWARAEAQAEAADRRAEDAERRVAEAEARTREADERAAMTLAAMRSSMEAVAPSPLATGREAARQE